MKKTFEIVNLVLASADLIDLIEITQNEDEYEKEAKIIAQYIDDNRPDVNALARYIRQVFVEYFNQVFDMECMELIANCILKNLEEE
jgi:hypothetical protein